MDVTSDVVGQVHCSFFWPNLVHVICHVKISINSQHGLHKQVKKDHLVGSKEIHPPQVTETSFHKIYMVFKYVLEILLTIKGA